MTKENKILVENIKLRKQVAYYINLLDMQNVLTETKKLYNHE